MPYIDVLFFASSLALGWGLSLATYRAFAIRNEWPMGAWHHEKPLVPVLIGAFVVVLALLFAAARVAEAGGVWIVLAGVAWAVFWTGFMRVGSQMSLILAPAAAIVFFTMWVSVHVKPGLDDERDYTVNSYTLDVPLPQRAPR